jgi:hypothetical protein
VVKAISCSATWGCENSQDNRLELIGIAISICFGLRHVRVGEPAPRCHRRDDLETAPVK